MSGTPNATDASLAIDRSLEFLIELCCSADHDVRNIPVDSLEAAQIARGMPLRTRLEELENLATEVAIALPTSLRGSSHSGQSVEGQCAPAPDPRRPWRSWGPAPTGPAAHDGAIRASARTPFVRAAYVWMRA